MSTTRASPRSWREARRQRALTLHEQHWSGKAIAEALGVSGGAVSQWLKRAREGGAEALRDRPPPGPTPRLSDDQRARIPTLLAKGPEAYGFIGDVWTTDRVATVIARALGVRYHPAHVSRLLRALRWSLQKPIRRATQRDEAAITTWRDDTRLALEKKGGRRGPDHRVGG